MTEASRLALEGLRDPATLQWYVVPLLAIVWHVWVVQIGKARSSGNWECVVAGATLLGADFLGETCNGWVFALTGRSAIWTTPGPTAFRLTVGWNIEIMFLFALLGLIYATTVGGNRAARVLGVPIRWFWAVAYTVVCVAAEVVLNLGGQLVWEYPFWNRTFAGIWLVATAGYFAFFLVTKFAMERKTLRGKVFVPACLFATAIALNVVAAAVGLVY
jgi:hypothetical protein